jgi:hypothetical protein
MITNLSGKKVPEVDSGLGNECDSDDLQSVVSSVEDNDHPVALCKPQNLGTISVTDLGDE